MVLISGSSRRIRYHHLLSELVEWDRESAARKFGCRSTVLIPYYRIVDQRYRGPRLIDKGMYRRRTLLSVEALAVHSLSVGKRWIRRLLESMHDLIVAQKGFVFFDPLLSNEDVEQSWGVL